MENAPHTVTLAQALADIASPVWCGTATELLELLPLELRPPNPAAFAKVLKCSETALARAGVTMQGKRQPKTGRRLVTLTHLSANKSENRQSGGVTAEAAGPQASTVLAVAISGDPSGSAQNRGAATLSASLGNVKQTGKNGLPSVVTQNSEDQQAAGNSNENSNSDRVTAEPQPCRRRAMFAAKRAYGI